MGRTLHSVTSRRQQRLIFTSFLLPTNMGSYVATPEEGKKLVVDYYNLLYL